MRAELIAEITFGNALIQADIRTEIKLLFRGTTGVL